ncbi:hypothetical protein GA0074692_6217 [Micromonospora pallida]|uniref:Uncharacterized protein n=1 Tax=Micromonospora pallida TaxID=145854 RepID=A0A1C6THN7_9ACTN|nr:hypothetical protein [Micromonospora pallida]SCL41244.1 hypothetical protein GA0074692_6217 [Micromonospora pallida]
MRTIRKVLAATAVAGAFTASLLAGAAPASATTEGTAGFGTFTGWGSSSIASQAIWLAELDAERWASMSGFDPFFDCFTTYSSATQVTPTYYNATVRISCFN